MAWIVSACVVGWLTGWSLQRRGPTLTQWLTLVVITDFVIQFAASMYIMAVDDPWRMGGTIAQHHPALVLPAPLLHFLDISAFFLVVSSWFVLGCAIGSANWFRRGQYGSRRMWACVGACLGSFVLEIVLFYAFWV